MTKKKYSDKLDTNEALRALANGDPALLNQLTRMLKGSYEESGLDAETFMLVRLAALAATDAAPSSWLMNLKVGEELGIPLDSAIGTLIAIAPVVGTVRIVSAAESILTALEIDKAMAVTTQHATASQQ
jgi:4-carboxymuconolactone decarboxylase